MSDISLTVWGNPLFGCELASYIARAKGSKKTVAVFDADLLCPTVDIFLGAPREKGGLPSLVPVFDEGRLDAGHLKNACSCLSEQLYVLTGSYSLESYEYYTSDIFSTISAEFKKCYDIIITLVNKSIYDQFTILSLHDSDLNIAPVESSIQVIREYNSYIEFIRKKQAIPSGKTKFVLFDRMRMVCENKYIMEELTCGNYLGKVSYSKCRETSLKNGSSCLKYYDKRNVAEYAAITGRMGI